MKAVKFLVRLAVGCLMLGWAGLASAQTLVIGRGADGNSLDPHESVSFEAIMMADLAFDGLVRYDGNTLKFVPALAESWEVSADGLLWTFKLRKGVTFHDGTPFNADAVVFSFERQRDKENTFYRRTFARWPSKFPSLTKTEKIDDFTVRLVLTAPSPALLANLAIYTGYIVSPTAVQKDPEAFRNNPVGTGAFKFVRFQKDNFTEYARNDSYWRGKPKLERVVVRTIPDNEVRLLALRKGEIQMAYGVAFSQFGDVEKDPSLKLLTSSTLGISLIYINNEKPPFNDVRVRQAVIHAINRDRIFKTVFFGRGEIADQIIPPGFVGHIAKPTDYPYDPEKAKKLLADAGQGAGFKATLISWDTPRPYMPSPRDVAALLKSDLARVGIELDIQTTAFNTHLQDRAKGEYGLSMGGWIAGTLDPDGEIFPLFHSSMIRPIDILNVSRWRNAESDALLKEAGQIYDEAKRQALYGKAQDIITAGAPAILLAYPINAIAIRKEVQGAFIHSSNWVPLDEVTISR